MKKFLYFAVAAIAALSSCQSDDILNDNVNDNDNNNANAPVFTATIEGEGATRTAIGQNSETNMYTMVNWSNGDQISINGSLYSTTSTTNTAVFTLVDGQTAAVADAQGKYKAYYPASMYNNGTITLPASYTYAKDEFNMPMYAESKNATLAFKNLCGVLAIKVPSTQMKKIKTFEVLSNMLMHGTIGITVKDDGTLSYTLSGKSNENYCKTVVDCGSTLTNFSSYIKFYVPLLPDTYYPITIKISDGTNTKIMQTTKINGISIERNNIYPITFAENYKKIGNSDDINLLPGVFTVADGKTVRFTRSNLYRNGYTFRFEANQIGHPTKYNPDHIGHFYWTTAETNSYKEGNGTITKNTTVNDKFWCDGSDDNHKLTVDGTTGLYALSKAEWEYLLFSRKDADKLNKKNVTVAGIANCLIIAPDGYDYSKLLASYPADEWAIAEADGLVCLPPTSRRSTKSLDKNNTSTGYYWTSTPDGSDATNAGCFKFTTAQFGTGDAARKYGCAIRLVK